jgi:hypothetical protein
MTPDDPRPLDEATWRNRFILLNLTRIGGTIVVLIALLIWHTDLLREGGLMAVGLPLALIGLVISFWGPKQLARKWKTPPAP